MTLADPPVELLSVRVRTGTRQEHDAAMGSGFLDRLADGSLPRAAYADLAVQHWYIYESLERAAGVMAGDSVGAPFVIGELTRLPSLTADLRHLTGETPSLSALDAVSSGLGGAASADGAVDSAVPAARLAGPGEAVPRDARPGEAVPRDARPGNEVPGDARPGNEVPGDARPGNEVPGDARPGNEVPGDAVPGRAGGGLLVPLPSTVEYVRRIRAVAFDNAWAFVAHHYTRYMGDLSGGQYLGPAIGKAYGLEGAGCSFFRFDGVKPPAFRKQYRELLDGAAFSAEEQDLFLAEVAEAYRLNIAVLAELRDRWSDAARA
jgi:heme oxygenase